MAVRMSGLASSNRASSFDLKDAATRISGSASSFSSATKLDLSASVSTSILLLVTKEMSVLMLSMLYPA